MRTFRRITIIISCILLLTTIISANITKASSYDNGKVIIDDDWSGNIGSVITNIHSNLEEITRLEIHDGKLYPDDVYWIRDNLPNLETLIVGDYAGFSGFKIPDCAFHFNMFVGGHKKLKNVVITCIIEEIGDYAFNTCDSLKNVNIKMFGIIDNAKVGFEAFRNSHLLENVALGRVEILSDGAFYNCTNLSEVTATGVDNIGNNAFYNCSNLTYISLNTATNIGNGAFRGCASLASIELKSVASVGNDAFFGCTSLTGAEFSVDPPSVGTNAFYDCPVSREVYVSPPDSNVDKYKAVNDGNTGDNLWYGWTIIKYSDVDATLKEWTITTNEGTEYKNVYSVDVPFTVNAVTISGTVNSDGARIASIIRTDPYTVYAAGESIPIYFDKNTFNIVVNAPNPVYSKTYRVTINRLHNTFKSIDSFVLEAFDPDVVGNIDHDNLTVNLTVPYNTDVTDLVPTISLKDDWEISPASGIGQDFSTPFVYTVTDRNGNIFDCCVFLNAGSYDNGTISISSLVSSLETAVTNIHGTLTDVKGLTINGSEVNFNDVDWIRQNLPNLQSLEITGEAAVQNDTLPECAFNGSDGLKSVNIPSLKIIGKQAFSSCDSLTSVILPEVTSVGEAAFMGSGALTSISLPKAKDIGKYVFYPLFSSSSLTSASLPEVTSISEYAFVGCSALTEITMGTSPPSVGALAFEYCASPRTVKVPKSAVETYKAVNDGNTGDDLWYGWAIVGEDPPVTISVSNTDATTYGGSDGNITVTASGGSGTYEYNIDDGSGFMEENWQDSNIYTDLSAGTYSVKARDKTDTGNVSGISTVTISEPSQVTIITAKTDATTYGGSDGNITVTASGGSGTYEYNIDDDSGFMEENWQDSNIYTDLSAGTYSVKARDKTDTGNVSGVSTVTIGEPSQVTISIAKTDATAYGGSDGSITVTASGGSGSYEYTLDSGTWQDANEFTDLSAGSYEVLARDKTDTNNVSSASTVTISQPNKPSGTGNGTTPTPEPTPKPETKKNDDGSVVVTVPEPEVDEETGQANTEVSSEDLENAFGQAEANEEGEKKIELEIPKAEGVKGYQVQLPKTALEADGKKEIEIKTDIGTVTLPGNMLGNEQSGAPGNISLSFEKLEKEILDEKLRGKIGDRPVIEISCMENGEVRPWENKDAPVTISLPYTLQEGENPEKVVVWYIDGEGNAVEVPNGRYNKDTGMVVFDVFHFSTYAVAYVEKTFNDLNNHLWAKHSIEVLASRGIIHGTGNNNYSPGAYIIRADFLALLVRTLELNADFENNFNDVKQTDYYYEAVGTAKELGITTGVGNNKFAPKTYITRQDMMVMTEKALRIKGFITGEADYVVLDSYKDKSLISEYAVDSVALLVNQGVITGSNNMINPKGNTTRAESAVVIYRINNLE